MDSSSSIPVGFCQCGCGAKTDIASRSDSKKGHVKGESFRFLPRHAARLRKGAVATLICEQCGGEFKVSAKEAHRRAYCSMGCLRDARYGRHVNVHGYHVVSISNHPVLAHRMIMEQHLGRSLSSDEVIHHKDGNRLNNDIRNLQLTTQSEHMRIHRSLIGWAKNHKHCAACGTTERRHVGHGLCTACYQAFRKRQRRSR